MWTNLISVDQLAQHREDLNWIILDVRHDLMNAQAGRDAYRSGHLPHAQFVHLDEQCSGNKTAANGDFLGRHPLPARDQFIEVVRELGIHNQSQVVIYDAHGGMYAARVWWMLRWLGHEAVAVLDGGLPAWQAQGHALTQDVPSRATSDFGAHESLVKQVSVIDVVRNLNQVQFQVVDARAADRFRGENETMDPVGGHIPGAKNRFFKDNLQADGRFKSPEQLRQEWSAVISDANHSVMQCGSGVTACHNLLALDIAGLQGAALYPGSWSEWCADAQRPVATGN